jgi:rSAM/selenodomain-associated transferase 2
MKFSVIIPTLNEADNIGKTVRHIQQHGGERLLEIIVTDGGSTDATMEEAARAGARVFLAPIKGRGGQMDYGARQSNGGILYFVHADTLPPPTFAADIEAGIRAGWRMGNFRYDFNSPRRSLRFNAFFTKFRWFFTQGGDRTFFILRETYFALGGYDPRCVLMEEYDFLRRAKKAGHDFVVLPAKCLVSARKYEKNSWLRVQLANFVAYHLWAGGWVSPAKLKWLYWKMLRR